MRTPVKIAFATVVLTQLVAVTLAWPLGFGHAGLTLATSLGACFNASMLFVSLRRREFYVPRSGWLVFMSRIFVALAVLGAVLAWLVGTPREWLDAGLWARVGRLGVLVVGGGCAYFGALFLLGFRLGDFDRKEVVHADKAVNPEGDR